MSDFKEILFEMNRIITSLSEVGYVKEANILHNEFVKLSQKAPMMKSKPAPKMKPGDIPTDPDSEDPSINKPMSKKPAPKSVMKPKPAPQKFIMPDINKMTQQELDSFEIDYKTPMPKPRTKRKPDPSKMTQQEFEIDYKTPMPKPRTKK